jgi:signal transduction histidine kinase
MIEFNYRESDFATLFDGYCYMGWSNVNPNVKVTIENPYNHLLVKIDEQQIGTIIQKLCVNAAKHTTEGSLRAKYEYRHGDLSISLEDTGDGLNEEMQKHIFERFARNELNKRYGTGLDMPIIQELVHQMGGAIEVQSEEGKGSTCYVTIPCELISMDKKSEIAV